MSTRDFSDSIKLETIKANLERHNGKICCDVCGTNLSSIRECHFDHIHPFSKGGKSTAENCQMLCSKCNLKKNDKVLKDFILEEKAKQFLDGNPIHEEMCAQIDDLAQETSLEITKDVFDSTIVAFIQKKGNISKVDFGREYNKLPSIRYVKQYYGDLTNLKKAFGIEDLSCNWNRETIKEALKNFIVQNGGIAQKDMKKTKGLPSLPCVLNYYPEYKNFTDIKRGLCGLNVPIQWTKEVAIKYGKSFVSKNGRITQKDLRAENKLPSAQVIDRLFGSLANYQALVGSEVSARNEFISKEEIQLTVEKHFGNKERVVESQKVFYETFPLSASTISKRYGTFASFCQAYGIKVLVSKVAKYSKREIDDIISKWIKEGHDIPKSHELSKSGLPSRDVILKYYEDWREPFFIYKKLYEEINRH